MAAMVTYPNLNALYLSPRLRARLAQIPQHGITTVVAPTGYGKSTAASWWQTHCPRGALVLRQIVTGPSLTDRGKPEQRNLTFAGASVLSKAGVLCSICTDHPETPLQYLSLCAALAEKNGLGHREALEAITIHPAKIAGLDGEIGSLEIGKWADMALFDGDPLVLASRCRGVWIQGRKWM